MNARRKTTSLEDVFEACLALPWWLGFGLAAGVFLLGQHLARDARPELQFFYSLGSNTIAVVAVVGGIGSSFVSDTGNAC